MINGPIYQVVDILSYLAHFLRGHSFRSRNRKLVHAL
jgi:hypothetical protein